MRISTVAGRVDKSLVRQEKVRMLPITPEIAMRSMFIAMHGDPADRIIMATALAHQCELVTVDKKIREAGAVPTIW